MKNRVLAVFIMLVFTAWALTSCGGKGDESTSPDVNVSPAASDNAATEKNNKSNEKKNNLQAVLDLMKATSEKNNFPTTRKYGDFLGQIIVDYKSDIKNPYHGGTQIYAIDRNELELENKEMVLKNHSASIIAIANDLDYLKDLDKKIVTYGCNAQNKGMVMAFAYRDGFYLYEIDENGNKINETTYMFPESK